MSSNESILAVQAHAEAYARSLALEREAARVRGKERLRRALGSGYALASVLIWLRFDLGTAVPYIDQVFLNGRGETLPPIYYPLLGTLAFLPNVGRVLVVHWRDVLGNWLPLAVGRGDMLLVRPGDARGAVRWRGPMRGTWPRF